MSGSAGFFRAAISTCRRRCRHAHAVDASSGCGRFSSRPKVRDWFNEHLTSGTLERIVIAVNAPFETLKAQRPADPRRRIVDRGAGDELRGPAGRRSAGAARRRPQRAHRRARRPGHARQGDRRSAVGPQARHVVRLFEVPDTAPHAPPARVRFKLDGPVPAAAELLRMDRLRDVRRAVRSGGDPRHISARRSRSACRSRPICRRARPITRSPSTPRISPPTA